MFEEDWFMRQVDDMVRFLAGTILKKNTTNYEVTQEVHSDADRLYLRINELLEDDKINEAENLLFEKIDGQNRRYLEIAVDFYARLNALDDDTLEKNNFSREEIGEGLKEAAKVFDIPMV